MRARAQKWRSPRAAAALEARAAGRALEKWADADHGKARARGIVVDMRHISPRVEMMGRGRAVVVGEACADFVGLAFNGIGVCVECKSTKDARLSYSQIEKPQRAQLDAYTDAGAAAILLVEFRTLPGAPKYAVPWQAVPWQSRRKGAYGSAAPADLEPWRVRGDVYLSRFFDRIKPTP